MGNARSQAWQRNVNDTKGKRMEDGYQDGVASWRRRVSFVECLETRTAAVLRRWRRVCIPVTAGPPRPLRDSKIITPAGTGTEEGRAQLVVAGLSQLYYSCYIWAGGGSKIEIILRPVKRFRMHKLERAGGVVFFFFLILREKSFNRERRRSEKWKGCGKVGWLESGKEKSKRDELRGLNNLLKDQRLRLLTRIVPIPAKLESPRTIFFIPVSPPDRTPLYLPNFFFFFSNNTFLPEN